MDKEVQYRVVEHFISINGEGKRAGQLAIFIRFSGCNLACLYCDTVWANQKEVEYKVYSRDDLIRLIEDSKVKNVTLTGGEPMIQEGIGDLIKELRKYRDIRVEIETNGSVDISRYLAEPVNDNISFTLDYKTGCSGMETKMFLNNYRNIRGCDTVKFVVGGTEDIEEARIVVDTYKLTEKGCSIYISPCFGKIDPKDIVDYLVRHKWNDINVQLQLHKYIWSPDMRGV